MNRLPQIWTFLSVAFALRDKQPILSMVAVLLDVFLLAFCPCDWPCASSGPCWPCASFGYFRRGCFFFRFLSWHASWLLSARLLSPFWLPFPRLLSSLGHFRRGYFRLLATFGEAAFASWLLSARLLFRFLFWLFSTRLVSHLGYFLRGCFRLLAAFGEAVFASRLCQNSTSGLQCLFNFKLTVLERTNYPCSDKTQYTMNGDEKEKGKTHVS